jgi:hypothetical protein
VHRPWAVGALHSSQLDRLLKRANRIPPPKSISIFLRVKIYVESCAIYFVYTFTYCDHTKRFYCEVLLKAFLTVGVFHLFLQAAVGRPAKTISISVYIIIFVSVI